MAGRPVRIEVVGPTSEAAVAVLCARRPELARDDAAPLGAPAASGEVTGGAAILDTLTTAAAHALDGADLMLTVGGQ
jgi:hypothetical protein